MVGGSSTLSITWMTPFDAATSAVVTVASLTVTPPSAGFTSTVSPCTVAGLDSAVTSAAITFAGSTW